MPYSSMLLLTLNEHTGYASRFQIILCFPISTELLFLHIRYDNIIPHNFKENGPQRILFFKCFGVQLVP